VDAHTSVDFLNSPETLSLALQLIPLIGDGYSIAAGFAGYDWIAGRTLSEDERPLYVAAGLAPFALGGMVIAGKGLAKLAPRTMDAAGEAWQAYRGSRFASEAGGFTPFGRFGRGGLTDEALRMGRGGRRRLPQPHKQQLASAMTSRRSCITSRPTRARCTCHECRRSLIGTA
jgi:hypothetical protein